MAREAIVKSDSNIDTDRTSTNKGLNGRNGNDGENGDSGDEGIGDVINNYVTNVTKTVTNITEDITEITEDVTDIVENVTNVVNSTTNNVTDIVDNILGGGDPDVDLWGHNDLDMPQIDLNLDPVEGIIGDIATGIGITHTDDSAVMDVGVIAADMNILNATMPVNAPLASGMAEVSADAVNMLLEPNVDTLAEDAAALADVAVNTIVEGVSDIVENPVEAVTDILGGASDIEIEAPILGESVNGAIDDVMDGAGAVLGGVSDLLGEGLSMGSEEPDTDTDLLASNDLGLTDVDVGLDPIENLVGDIDINMDIASVDDGVLNLHTDAIVADASVLDQDVAVPDAAAMADDIVDDIEGIVSDIDAASTLLEDSGVVGEDALLPSAGDLTDALWSEDAGVGDAEGITDTLGDLVGGIDDGAGALPSPSGTISEGLGLLDIDSGSSGSLGGGLFG
ncbi:MAG: hypothetical protein OXT65_02225 [Alphaproteobacteria bacterium]|nr:hypothetical protein [Alphaproteobacteria bacterium]